MTSASSKDQPWILPRDPEAEQRALQATRHIWGPDAHVAYIVGAHGVAAQARSPLTHGSRLEISVRGVSNADAAKRLALCLGALAPVPRGFPARIWIVGRPNGERHYIDKEFLGGVGTWARGQDITVIEYRLGDVVHRPPPKRKPEVGR